MEQGCPFKRNITDNKYVMTVGKYVWHGGACTPDGDKMREGKLLPGEGLQGQSKRHLCAGRGGNANMSLFV